jgi:hypothetical protein
MTMRTMTFLGLALLTLPAPACAQEFNPYQPPPPDARVMRARREWAFAYAGGTPQARTAVEKYGENFVVAVSACSQEVAARLAEFSASPDGLGKLPKPNDLLNVIGGPQMGDDVALWAMQHQAELRDVDACMAFMLAPLQYTLALQSLSAGAAQYRANRLAAAATPPPAPPQGIYEFRLPADWRPFAVGGAVLLLVLWWLWRRRNGP